VTKTGIAGVSRTGKIKAFDRKVREEKPQRTQRKSHLCKTTLVRLRDLCESFASFAVKSFFVTCHL